MDQAEALKTLSQTAAELQTETEALNADLAAFDERLAKIGPGVSVWLEQGLPEQPAWQLGYARVNSKMGLAVRQTQTQTEVIPIVNAPRHVRVTATALFGDLIEALIACTREHLSQVQVARARLQVPK